VTFWVLLAVYVGLTICVLVPSTPVLALDQYLAALHLKQHHPEYRTWINHYVMFGQRGPATLAFLPVFLWVTWRTRSKRPLVLLGTALVLLNFTVGVAKYATGRVGPMFHSDRDVHLIFAGGNIYPSGHVSNAVVLYGLIAWILPRFRKQAIAVAVFLSVTVGLSTVYLRTHWFSDVVGGWLAGSLVLLSLPTALPYVERWVERVQAWAVHRYALLRRNLRRRREPGPAVARPLRPAAAQESVVPVRRSAPAHSAAASRLSMERLDERTRVG
jgi:membrane-associated phospholipid phosphatase